MTWSSPNNQMPELPKSAGIIQFNVHLGDIKKNIKSVEKHMASIAPLPGSIVVLPELWATGFAYQDLGLLSDQTPDVLQTIKNLAQKYQIIIAGSLPEKDKRNDEHIYNSLFFTGPDGIIGSYRKQQLFGPMGEDKHFSPGTSPEPVHTPLGIMAGLVCYDLRFPDLAAHQVSMGARLIIVSAQWPAARVEHWSALLKARAIENQAYLIACNRCGSTDDVVFGGHSAVISPDGKVILQANDQEFSSSVELEEKLINDTRSFFNTAAPTPHRFLAKDKIISKNDLIKKISTLKSTGKKIVFTNGCFDILHPGHVTYLEEARRHGDCLVVGLNSDSSISSIKGPDRPINQEEGRARVLAALGCVDFVCIFSDDTPHELIISIMPDVLIKGADWPIDQIVGAREVLEGGGTVVTVPMVENFSTTGLINKISLSCEKK